MSNLTQSILMWAAPCAFVIVGFALAVCGGAKYEQNDGREVDSAGALEAIGWILFGTGIVWIVWRLAID